MRIAGGEIIKGTVPSRPECESLLLLNCYGPRSIDTLCSVSQRTANPEKRKIGDGVSVVNPSWRFYGPPRRFNIELINT